MVHSTTVAVGDATEAMAGDGPGPGRWRDVCATEPQHAGVAGRATPPFRGPPHPAAEMAILYKVDPATSLRSECRNRINAGRTPRWEIRGHSSHAEQDDAHHYECDGVLGTYLVKERLQKSRRHQSNRQPDSDPHADQRKRPAQHRAAYQRGCRTERDANPDFARLLADRR